MAGRRTPSPCDADAVRRSGVGRACVLPEAELLLGGQLRWRTLILLADDPSAGVATRGLVRTTLDQWGLAALMDDVELCASELIGNAILHAVPCPELPAPLMGQRITVALRALPCWLILEVTDEDPGPVPLPRHDASGAAAGQHPGTCTCSDRKHARAAGVERRDMGGDDLATHGRGLTIVQGLADDVSWLPRMGGGKTVSARFDTSNLAA